MLLCSLLLFASTCFQEVYAKYDRKYPAGFVLGPTQVGVHIEQEKPGGVFLRLGLSRDSNGKGDFHDLIQSAAAYDNDQAVCGGQKTAWCLAAVEYHSQSAWEQIVGEIVAWPGGTLKINYYEDFKASTWNQTITDPRTGRVLTKLATPIHPRNMAMRSIDTAVAMLDCANPVVKAHSYHDIIITLSSPDPEFARTGRGYNCTFDVPVTTDKGRTWLVRSINMNELTSPASKMNILSIGADYMGKFKTQAMPQNYTNIRLELSKPNINLGVMLKGGCHITDPVQLDASTWFIASFSYQTQTKA
ncbi:hypothetical protein BCR37DRAFT_414789 [Protomyces lactucae-debilis]|uniref:Concanavalin A-like lectin/glucanase domain-containing protein n=1 Tax=Protomyces lactucae-debilis TaxID=2754530 RepID=A0A1Y2F6D5_PROLT|nr:uncharacterized protein BCR37DRAFT_414789 [Protomyces lactucae-debilis]ORY79044.1 hypothetical protein BCR37DRAFT_414789 [Protomyces lactucae-debilis]